MCTCHLRAFLCVHLHRQTLIGYIRQTLASAKQSSYHQHVLVPITHAHFMKDELLPHVETVFLRIKHCSLETKRDCMYGH